MAEDQVPIRGRWLALLAALLGWLFDGLEMGLFPLVARPALRDLLGPETSVNVIDQWFAVITATFLVGAATGGVLFGWLGDKIGRVRAMTISVLVYAGSSGACSAAQTPEQLALLRFLGSLGMGGEWALGVALVMELWPTGRRDILAGLIGAAGNLGYTVVGGVAMTMTWFPTDIASIADAIGIQSAGNWRLLMLCGAVPAILTIFMRFFVPESERWQRQHHAGRTSHWSGRDLFAVLIAAIIALAVIMLWTERYNPGWWVRGLATIIGFILIVCGFLYPAWRFLGRVCSDPQERGQTIGRMLLGAGLSGVPLLATWAGVMWQYNFVDKLTAGKIPEARPTVMIVSSLGAAIGCVIGALLSGRYGRRKIYAALCIFSLLILAGFYRLNQEYNSTLVLWSAGLGAISAAFYGWLPLYLPELFRTKIRASAQGFAFNSGRIIAALGALQMGTVLAYFNNDYAAASTVAIGVYLIGLVIISFAPETHGDQLLDE